MHIASIPVSPQEGALQMGEARLRPQAARRRAVATSELTTSIAAPKAPPVALNIDLILKTD
jgi:hypothetical protein